jgi:hypothetical protein
MNLLNDGFWQFSIDSSANADPSDMSVLFQDSMLPTSFVRLDESSPMDDTVHNTETATEVAKAYADDECLGEVDEIVHTTQSGSGWVVEFVTQTFTDTYKHRVRINPPGNVFSHERTRCGSDEDETNG